MTADFFCNQMIDLCQPLVVLANRMSWQGLEAFLAHRFARQVRVGKSIQYMSLFDPSVSVVDSDVDAAGLARPPTSLMLVLLYLKHAFNESNAKLVGRWYGTPTCQYFSGNRCFVHHLPSDPIQLVTFRKLLTEEGVEELPTRIMEGMPFTGIQPRTAFGDPGSRGVDKDNPGRDIKHRGKFKTLSKQDQALLRRRQAIEPIIGHLKSDQRLNRCHLKRPEGGSLHMVLRAARYNQCWLLRGIAKESMGPFGGLSGAAECSRFILNWLRRFFDLRTNPLSFGCSLARF